MSRFAIALVLVAVAVGAGGCGSSGSGSSSDSEDGSSPFKLGVEAPLSGEQAVLGKGMLKGAQLAAAELNEDGGIEGRHVRLVPIDDAADPETGVRAARKAISDGLDGVVGPYNSGVGVETLPLYIKNGLVPIRLTSDPSTNGMGFTLQPMTYQIAPVATEALTDWLGAKSVAIAYDPTQNYTVSVSKAVKSSLEAAGVKVTAYEKVKPGRSSYTDVVKKLDAGNPEAIYAAVYFPEGGLIAKEMAQSGAKAQCVADYASYDTGFVKTAGVAAASNCPVVGVPAPDDFESADKRVAAYEKRFAEAPGTWSPYTYDSVNFLAYGIEKAGTTEADQVSEELGAVHEWDGWTGKVTIDPKNGNRQPATVVVTQADKQGQFHVDKHWANTVDASY